ncbi:hypothetical protein AAFC00_002763 [Neodothiora populina]|uniref:MYND-type domain-containing protein n=1 Tax=Neodothiora populina TaxID=2781224 RepID=A0ABR3P8K2_9PEZI
MIKWLQNTTKNVCVLCKASESLENTLKPCEKCQQVKFCSEKCEIRATEAGCFHTYCCPAYLQRHQIRESLVCAQAAMDERRAQQASDEALIDAKSENIRGWLTNLVQNDVFGVLIDSYRLRADDEFVFEKKRRGLYAGGRNNKPIDDFKDFLNRAEQAKPKLLPHWLNYSRRLLCERKAEGCSSPQLMLKINERQINDTYFHKDWPIMMRTLASKIYGHDVDRSPRATVTKDLPFIVKMFDSCLAVSGTGEGRLQRADEEFRRRMVDPPASWKR